MEEAESVSARKATLLDPTEEDETVNVLRRRLFDEVDEAKAASVVAAYRSLWDHNRPLLPSIGVEDRRGEMFAAGYPIHPELLDTLRNKTATLGNFQRVRGMLRLLGRTVGRLWKAKPKDAYAIHLHHLDPGFEPIRKEIVTRLGQREFLPALRADVAATEGEQPALAEQLNKVAYIGLPPYGSYVARAIFFHSLAFNDPLKGASREQVRYSVVSPATDISFIDDAITRFVQASAYLDDRPNVSLRFQAEANLTQIIRRQEEQVDKTEARNHLNDRIREIFRGSKVFNPIPFAGGPYDVPDDAGDGKPSLVIIGYDAASRNTWPTTRRKKPRGISQRPWRPAGSNSRASANSTWPTMPRDTIPSIDLSHPVYEDLPSFILEALVDPNTQDILCCSAHVDAPT